MCTVGANCRKRIAVPMHGKQMSKPCLGKCIRMPKMRGFRSCDMHSIGMAKGQQQEQQQADKKSLHHAPVRAWAT